VPRDLFRQASDLGRGDVGRIGQDQLEFAVDAAQPIGAYETCAFGNAESARISRRKLERGGADIGAKPARLGQFGQERDEDAAGAGAEIEQPAWPIARALLRAKLERSLDRDFGVGTRV